MTTTNTLALMREHTEITGAIAAQQRIADAIATLYYALDTDAETAATPWLNEVTEIIITHRQELLGREREISEALTRTFRAVPTNPATLRTTNPELFNNPPALVVDNG